MLKKIIGALALIALAIACGKKKSSDTTSSTWSSSLPSTISSTAN